MQKELNLSEWRMETRIFMDKIYRPIMDIRDQVKRLTALINERQKGHLLDLLAACKIALQYSCPNDPLILTIERTLDEVAPERRDIL